MRAPIKFFSDFLYPGGVIPKNSFLFHYCFYLEKLFKKVKNVNFQMKQFGEILMHEHLIFLAI